MLGGDGLSGGPLAFFRHELSRARSALPLARYAPDHIANVVCHQNGAVGTECYPYRSSIGNPLVRSEEPRQNIPRRPGGREALPCASGTLVCQACMAL
jgi:hypothetical protein